MSQQARKLGSAWSPPSLSRTPQSTSHEHTAPNLPGALQSTVAFWWNHPAASPRIFRGSNPNPKHASRGSPCSALHFAGLSSYHSLAHSQGSSQAEFRVVPITPFSKWSPSLCTARFLHQTQAFLTASHLANSSPSFKSQLSYVSSRNPSLTPRSLGRVPLLNPPASVCSSSLY